ncbi:MAG: thiamine pyrophosphate-binding protein [Hyphomicrobiaceae bacterium]
MARRAADLLVDCLAQHGTDRVFCVPGESYLAVLDALHDRNAIETVICRHEGGAGFMGLADAKVSGQPGIVFVSRGPGATNASIAVHVAEQDAVPLILFIGQVPRAEVGRRSFQEVDYAKTFSDMAKGVWVIDDADRIPEILARAYAVAKAPTPGPVVIVLPEDMLEDMTSAEVIEPIAAPRVASGAEALEDVVARLARSERPLVIAGGGVGSPEGRAALLAASEAHALPVALTFKRQDLFPNAHPNYVGHLGFKIPKPMVDRFAESDLILAVGTRLGEVTTQGYTFPATPVPRQPLIHVYDDPGKIGREFRTELPIVADATAFLRALAGRSSTAPAARKAWIERLHAPVAAAMPWAAPKDGLLDMGAIVAALVGKVADDTIFITDAGNFSGWLHRHFPFSGKHLMVGTVGGAMGLGMPAAVAAGLRHPDRTVITFIGDGGMLMTGSELATAVQYGVPIKVFVSNNGSYGTIRMHQEKSYKGRVHGTELQNPDFARMAESFGATGLTISTIEEAAEIVAEALETEGPVVVDVHTTLEHISPFANLADLGN